MTDSQTTPTLAVAAKRAPIARIGLLGAGAAALVAVGMLAAAATAAPSGTIAANTTGSTSASIDLPVGAPLDGPMGGRFGGMHGFGGITITAISGSNVSLKTVDGWTRTIAIAGDTVLQKEDATIALSDLKVGDQVQVRQTRLDDGSFKVTELHVLLPRAGGTVTAVTGTTITVEGRDGSTTTINVTAGTTYQVGTNEDAALADIKVDMHLMAVGTVNADGSFTASAVRAVDPANLPGRGGHGPWDGQGRGPWGNGSAPTTDGTEG